MYCALNYELQNLPILSEYSHTKNGRIDFFVFDRKWGIEVLQCGSMSEIAEHAARFAAGGRYREWNIFKDYIILNFCSKSTVQTIEIEGNGFPVTRDGLVLVTNFFQSDVEVQSRILQVALDSNEYTAEVYTYDKELLATLTLGEGRQRLDDYKDDSPSEEPGYLQFMQNRIAQVEEKEKQVEEKEKQLEEKQKQMEQEMEDKRRLGE